MNIHQNILDRNQTVLVVVDIQEPFLRNIFERDRVVTNVIKLVKAAKALQVPVIATLQRKEKMGDIIPELAEVLPDEERIDKTTFSCCGVKEFEEAIAQHGSPTVLICGIEAHICLNQTVLDLLRLNYNVHVAVDAVSSRKESDYKTGIEKMRYAGAIITSTEASIFELLRDAAAPEFKTILELVK